MARFVEFKGISGEAHLIAVESIETVFPMSQKTRQFNIDQWIDSHGNQPNPDYIRDLNATQCVIRCRTGADLYSPETYEEVKAKLAGL